MKYARTTCLKCRRLALQVLGERIWCGGIWHEARSCRGCNHVYFVGCPQYVVRGMNTPHKPLFQPKRSKPIRSVRVPKPPKVALLPVVTKPPKQKEVQVEEIQQIPYYHAKSSSKTGEVHVDLTVRAVPMQNITKPSVVYFVQVHVNGNAGPIKNR